MLRSAALDDRLGRERLQGAAVKILDTSDDPSPPPFEKLTTEEGVQLALDGEGHVLAVLPDVVPEVARFALRRGSQPFLGRTMEWTYVELENGVRVYMSAAGVVITRADINPGSASPPSPTPTLPEEPHAADSG